MDSERFADLTQWRHVSARELARRIAELLDEMETTGDSIVVTRYNRRCAVISPVAAADLRRRLPKPQRDLSSRGRAGETEAVAEVEGTVEVGPSDAAPDPVLEAKLAKIHLDPVQRRVLLLVVGSGNRGWYQDEVGYNGFDEAFDAIALLSAFGLVDRKPYSSYWRPTKLGLVLAGRLVEVEVNEAMAAAG